MKRIGLQIAILSLVVLPLFSTNEDPVRRLFINRAAQILNSEHQTSDDLDAVSQMIEMAMEYGQDDSDILYLRARLLLKNHPVSIDINAESQIHMAYNLMERSIKQEKTSAKNGIFRLPDKLSLWASLALRLKEYRTFLDKFSNLPPGEKQNLLLLNAAARSALYLGLDDFAVEFARTGEALSGSASEASFLKGYPRPEFRAIAVAAGSSSDIETLKAAWNRWGQSMEDSLMPWILSGYLNPREAGELPTLLSPSILKLSDIIYGYGNEEVEIPLLLQQDLSLLLRLQSRAKTDFSKYTGVLTADSNYDGFPEQWVRMDNGQLDYRRADEDQDGRYDWETTYSNGNPIQIRFGGNRLVLNYYEGAYPEVLTVVSREENVLVNASFRPGAFLWTPFEKDKRFPSFKKQRWNETSFWNGVQMISAEKTDLSGGKTTTWFLDGEPIRAEETGTSSSPMTRQIIYRDGVPTAGRRSYRMDSQDNSRKLWELYERYENGRLVGLAWDPGMKGSARYLRDWALNRYLETQIWDIDADGWIDYRRLLLPGGKEDSRALTIREAEEDDFLPWTAGDWEPWVDSTP